MCRQIYHQQDRNISNKANVKITKGVKSNLLPKANFPVAKPLDGDLELEKLKAMHELEVKFLEAQLNRMRHQTNAISNLSNAGTSKSTFDSYHHGNPEINSPSVLEYYKKLSSVNMQPRILTREQLAARQLLDKLKLPVFDGKPEDWLRFICNFEQSTAACAYSNVENLSRLSECIKEKRLTMRAVA